MSNLPWWQTAVIYQIYPRSFADSNGDGVGDLRGIAGRIDYLSDTLGVDAIWLSPFYPSPMKDFGYDVSDYCDVDPVFGSLDDFDHLLAAVHERGMRMIIDLVPNHTSDQHPWFVESRSSPANPKRDWYCWRDPKPDGSPPNNWLSAFGGEAWELDGETGQYYLHSFLTSQPDLNWRNPEVQEAMFDVVRFWLDRGVDGFRLDVAHFIMKDPEWRDNPPSVTADDSFKSMGEYDSQLHLHDKGHADAHRVFRDFRALLDGYEGDRFSVGEIHVFDLDEWAEYYGKNLDELHMPFNFSLVWAPWDAGRFRELVGAVEAAVPDAGWPNYVLGNHDERRLVGRYGRRQARVAAMLLLTLRGTPTLYYGDELGLTNVDIPRDLQQDPWALQEPAVESRDGCRTPMPWDGSPTAGFSPPDSADPWLPIPEEHRAASVAAQLEDPRSILELYRQLLRLRRDHESLRVGDYQSATTAEGVFAYSRTLGADQLLVALNFTDEERVVSTGRGEVLLSTGLDRDGSIRRRLILRPNEGVVIRLESFSAM
ncbi:MAG TPA: alpha-amylase family glycosyl hydrolase [Acidimicrobiia bacterium]|nr:alpha-amylase family glycosyl hydrolase [Acidimicrobiia bacterium]